MEDQIRNCKICQKEYSYLSTESDTCKDCIKKYPYFISFIEEGGMGVMNRAFGRVEVYNNTKPSEYAEDEIRFLFKDNQ